MKATTPTLDDWKKLYSLMAQVEELAPWEWMEEDDIFGFQMPGTEELGFVSVMGTLGEHYAVAVYQGTKGLSGFWHMQELGPDMTPEVLLNVPQLQASFEDREEITKEDRDVIKQLGLKFRGAKAWPQFRSFRPGCFPWYIEKAEAEMLICGLEQILDVAPRFKADPEMLVPTDDDHDYLVRVQETGIWKDTITHIDAHPGTVLKFQMNKSALDALKQAMPGQFTLEVDLFMLNNPIQENRKGRPYFPYMLMICDQKSKMILGTEMLQPLPSLEAMWESVPAIIVTTLAGRAAPKEFVVRDDLLVSLLEYIGNELGCKIKKSKRLPAIDSARRELNRFF
jgi:hypothetical protein